VSQATCYEQPLNERARALLRLEFLFQHIDHAMVGPLIWDSRAALQGLFDILAVTGRNEFKKELLKELERHAATLNRLRQTPGVDAGKFMVWTAWLLESVRQTDFLSAASTSATKFPVAPAGSIVPASLSLATAGCTRVRAGHLREWLAPLLPMQEATTLLLRLIRESASPQAGNRRAGFFPARPR
jgi:cell division protein ZapD